MWGLCLYITYNVLINRFITTIFDDSFIRVAQNT